MNLLCRFAVLRLTFPLIEFQNACVRFNGFHVMQMKMFDYVSSSSFFLSCWLRWMAANPNNRFRFIERREQETSETSATDVPKQIDIRIERRSPRFCFCYSTKYSQLVGGRVKCFSLSLSPFFGVMPSFRMSIRCVFQRAHINSYGFCQRRLCYFCVPVSSFHCGPKD